MKLILTLLALAVVTSIAWLAMREPAGRVGEIIAPSVANASTANLESAEMQIPEPRPEPEHAEPPTARAPVELPGKMSPEEYARFREDMRDEDERQKFLKQLGAEKGWDEKHKDDSRQALEARFKSTNDELIKTTQAWFDERFAAGDGEVSDRHPEYRRWEVYRILVEERGTKFTKIVLPKAEFPDAYALKDQAEWLWLKSQGRL